MHLSSTVNCLKFSILERERERERKSNNKSTLYAACFYRQLCVLNAILHVLSPVVCALSLTRLELPGTHSLFLSIKANPLSVSVHHTNPLSVSVHQANPLSVSVHQATSISSSSETLRFSKNPSSGPLLWYMHIIICMLVCVRRGGKGWAVEPLLPMHV